MLRDTVVPDPPTTPTAPPSPPATTLPSAPALSAYRHAVYGVRDLDAGDPCTAELLRLGLAAREPGGTVRPVDPSRTMQILMDRLSDGLADWNAQAGRIVVEIEQLGRNDLLFHQRAAAGVVLLPDRAAITAEVAACYSAADSELLVLDAGLTALAGPVPVVTGRSGRVLRARTDGLGDRPELLTSPSGRDHHVRVLSTAPFSMVIADRDRALVPLDVTGECGAALVRAPLLVTALAKHFDMLWDRAVDIGGGPGCPDALSPAALRVLRLLAAGFNDEQVAEQLHVTSRTVGRHVQTILAATGARTRFEACAKAFRRHWID